MINQTQLKTLEKKLQANKPDFKSDYSDKLKTDITKSQNKVESTIQIIYNSLFYFTADIAKKLKLGFTLVPKNCRSLGGTSYSICYQLPAREVTKLKTQAKKDAEQDHKEYLKSIESAWIESQIEALFAAERSELESQLNQSYTSIKGSLSNLVGSANEG